MADAEREIRAARNESLFRSLNEQLDAVRAGVRRAEYFCECARPTCAATILLLVEEYEHVRQDGDRFVVLPEHVDRDIERVLEEHGTYWIVEKIGVGRDVADALDPRA